MRRLGMIVLACLLSVALGAAAAALAPVPQTDLFISTLIGRKLARASALGGTPKLVVLAGSNGLFSHRCQAMEPVLNMPCVNASIAVGVGLDYLFARWKPVLHAGDVLYMPMEPVQYTRTRTANLVGPETVLLVHSDWPLLLQLPPDRVLASLLSIDLRSALQAVLTEPPRAVRQAHVDEALNREVNGWGDRTGHTSATAAGARGGLDAETVTEPAPDAIRTGYGTAILAQFVRWARAHGITVIGGLSTGFADADLPQADIDAMRAVFEGNGAQFLALPNRSRYPRHDFYDTRYHLNEACQIRHSVLVANALAGLLHRPAQPAPAWATQAACASVE